MFTEAKTFLIGGYHASLDFFVQSKIMTYFCKDHTEIIHHTGQCSSLRDYTLYKTYLIRIGSLHFFTKRKSKANHQQALSRMLDPTTRRWFTC